MPQNVAKMQNRTYVIKYTGVQVPPSAFLEVLKPTFLSQKRRVGENPSTKYVQQKVNAPAEAEAFVILPRCLRKLLADENNNHGAINRSATAACAVEIDA